MDKTPQDSGKGTQILHRVGHCLYRSESSRIYYAILKRGGKQIKRSLKTPDRELAERWLSVLQEKARRLDTSRGAKITFKEFGQRWLTVASVSLRPSSRGRQEGILRYLGKTFDAFPVRPVTKSQVETWAAQRSGEVSARTYNYERQILQRVFDYAVQEGLILDNPASDLKRPKVRKERPVIPTRAQFKKLLAEMRKETKSLPAADLCAFLAYSGCRLSEATAMMWGEVDTVNHDRLMGQLREKIRYPRVLGLIRRYLQAGAVLPDGNREPSAQGVPQGGPLSPLLANIVLTPLDRELERRGHRFARYADDFLVMVKSARAVERVMESLTRFIEEDLRQVVNRDKSQAAPLKSCAFLGF